MQSAVDHGFVAGFNEVLTLGALVCFIGAILALWLVREREIEREPEVVEQAPTPLAVGGRAATSEAG